MRHAPRRGAFIWLLRVCLAAASAALFAGLPSPPASAQSDLADGQWWRTQLEMDEVWRISQGDGVTVAVIDSGVDASVPELSGTVVPGADLVDGNGDGTVDRHPEGHGTGMASLIAGRGGDRGYRGVAPSATILPIAVLGDDESTDSDIEGIRFAVDNGADIISMSLGTPGTCPGPYVDAIRYAADHDVIVVAASGNDPSGLSAYPGNCPGVLTVGATDRQLSPWEDSHRSEHVDVAAPGVGISSIGPGGDVYGGEGTSSATALVSGVIALLRAEFPDDSADQILRRVFHTVGDIHTPGRDDATGYGIVQPIHALTEPLPPDAPNPVYERLNDVAAPLEPGAPGLAPAPESDDNDAQRLLIVGGIVLVAIIVGVVILAVALHNRKPRTVPYAGPPTYGPRPPPR